MKFTINNSEMIFGRSPKYTATIDYNGRIFTVEVTKKNCTIKNRFNAVLHSVDNEYTVDEDGALKNLRDFVNFLSI